MRNHLIYIYTVLLLLIPTTLFSQETKERVHIYGNIYDASTKEALPYTSVRTKNSTLGCSSDNDGHFSFHAPQNDTLIISSIGYKEEYIPLTQKTKTPLTIYLAPTEYTLGEVTIKPKKERYTRKDNPAVALAKEIIERRDKNTPKNKPFYSRKRHETLNIALNNFNSSKGIGKKFDFLAEYADTSIITGKPILNVSAREIIGTDYFRSTPERERKHIIARNRNGIDDVFTSDEIDGLFEEVFKDVDIFQDNISIFRSKFVSPLSKSGPGFYRYYIMDTVEIDGEKYTDLSFIPFNTESFGFTGHIYVATDSSYFIKSIDMNVPNDINMNFVEYMNIQQSFSKLNDGTRILNNERLVCEFKVINAISGFYAHRNVSFADYKFNVDEQALEILKSPTEVVEEKNSMNRSKDFWSENRIGTVSKKQQSVGSMMKKLRSNPFYYWTEKCISFLFTGWVPLRKYDPPVFYGPVNTTFSYNELEGLRLRTGAMTSAYLNPHLFGRFYVAYGCRDKKLKYMGEFEYSFKKKKEHANEFPIHSLRLRYEHDIFQYGQDYLYTNKDNFVLSIKRGNNDKVGYMRNAEFTYTHELHNHFSYNLTLRNRIDIASRFIQFERTATADDGSTTTTSVPNLKQSEVELTLRYAPKEKFLQSKWNRRSLTPEKPVFTLSHKVGFKGILGSEFYYHHTEARFQKRFWFSAFGYTDCILKTGKVWNKVPFPLLIIPNTNLSYTIQKESYWLMNPMEFLTDQYASWDLAYHMNGLIFNRIPLVRKLNWREVITFRGMFGHLSDKNRPDPLNTGVLYKLPYDDDYSNHYLKKTLPYLEMSVGIENIFKVLRVDYVRRLTYTDLPGISKWGIRIEFHVQF